MRPPRPSTPPTATAGWSTARCSSGWSWHRPWPTHPRSRRSPTPRFRSWPPAPPPAATRPAPTTSSRAGQVFFGVALAPTMASAPSVEAIADAQVPIVAAGSSASRDPASPHHFLYQAAAWLAHHLAADLVEAPGGHMAYLTAPAAVAEGLRPLLADRS